MRKKIRWYVLHTASKKLTDNQSNKNTSFNLVQSGFSKSRDAIFVLISIEFSLSNANTSNEYWFESPWMVLPWRKIQLSVGGGFEFQISR